jgi:hypothetical protein
MAFNIWSSDHSWSGFWFMVIYAPDIMGPKERPDHSSDIGAYENRRVNTCLIETLVESRPESRLAYWLTMFLVGNTN